MSGTKQRLAEMSSSDIDKMIKEKEEEARERREARKREEERALSSRNREENYNHRSESRDKVRSNSREGSRWHDHIPQAPKRERNDSRERTGFIAVSTDVQGGFNNTMGISTRNSIETEPIKDAAVEIAMKVLQDRNEELKKESDTLREKLESVQIEKEQISEVAQSHKNSHKLEVKIKSLELDLQTSMQSSKYKDEQWSTEVIRLETAMQELGEAVTERDSQILILQQNAEELSCQLKEVVCSHQAHDAIEEMQEESRRVAAEHTKMLRLGENELEEARSEIKDWELRTKKILEQNGRSEYEYGNKIIELEEELIRAKQYNREAEVKLNKLSEQMSKEKEMLHNQISAEKERCRDVIQASDERATLLREQMRAVERELNMLRKSNGFLEKRTSRQEKEAASDDHVKAEMKKMLGLAIELLTEIMNSAKQEKVCQGLYKACMYRWLTRSA